MNLTRTILLILALGCQIVGAEQMYMVLRLIDPAALEPITRSGASFVNNPDLRSDEVLVYVTDEQLTALRNEPNVALVYPASTDLIQGIPVHTCTPPKSDLIAEYIMTVGSGWRASGQTGVTLTYSVETISPKLGKEATVDVLARAMAEWSKYVQVDFEKTDDPQASRNLNVLFAAGGHGDSFPFDGPRRTLAHTFYPGDVNPEPIAGDLHFDEDENWNSGVDPDFFSVALHELGHALGLGHSDRPNAVMYPYYRRFASLLPDDIAAIRRIYSSREPNALEPTFVTTPAPTTANPAPSNSPSKTNATDKTAPTLRITYPATTVLSTTSLTARINGTAADSTGVVKVTWSASGGRTGAADGTTNWIIPELPLRSGDNTIVIRAYDEAGNNSFRSLTITRR